MFINDFLQCWHISVYSTKMGHVSYTFTIIGHLLSAPRGIKQIRSLQSFCQHNSIQITAIWFTLVYNTIWATFFIIILSFLWNIYIFVYTCRLPSVIEEMADDNSIKCPPKNVTAMSVLSSVKLISLQIKNNRNDDVELVSLTLIRAGWGQSNSYYFL